MDYEKNAKIFKALTDQSRLNNCNKLTLFMMNLVTETKDCICKEKSNCNCK